LDRYHPDGENAYVTNQTTLIKDQVTGSMTEYDGSPGARFRPAVATGKAMVVLAAWRFVGGALHRST
jgi:hypothetical protein